MENKKFACTNCDKSFESSAGLYKHRRKNHPDSFRVFSNVICWDKTCAQTFRHLRGYIEHLIANHPEAGIREQMFIFSSENEFKNWKTKMERETKSSYVRARGKRATTKGGTAKMEFHCNRLGEAKKKDGGNSLRKGKKLGSRKCTRSCPASVYVNINNSSGQYTVKYISVHLDHQVDLNYVDLIRKVDRVSAEEYSIIADVNRAHNNAITIDSEGKKRWQLSRTDEPNKWSLVIHGRKDLTFQITKNTELPCDDTASCLARCQRCTICRCSYTCSCPRFLQRTTICRHIHFLCANQQTKDYQSLVTSPKRELHSPTSTKTLPSSSTTTQQALEDEEAQEVRESVANLVKSSQSSSVPSSSMDSFFSDPLMAEDEMEIQREEVIEDIKFETSFDHDYSNLTSDYDNDCNYMSQMPEEDEEMKPCFILVKEHLQPQVLKVSGTNHVSRLGNPRIFFETLVQSKLSEIDYESMTNEKFQRLLEHVLAIPSSQQQKQPANGDNEIVIYFDQ